jgi:CRP/FNR family transcriptional regulator
MSQQTVAFSQPIAAYSGQARPTKNSFEQSLGDGQLRRVECKELLFAEGDVVSHVYRVETGALALYRVLPDGRRQVMGFAYPGEIVGLGIESAHAMNAQAVKPTRVRCLSMASLRQTIERDPTLGFRLYEATARELAATRDLMMTTGQRSACERVASFLMALARRNQRNGKDPSAIELPMTRADIGDFLGLTIETVSRTFSKFRALKLIELPQTNAVKLLNVERLRELAEGNG